MSNAKSFTVTDRKGVVVGTWTRGEVFNLRAGDTITFNSGIPTFRGKVLNLPVEVQTKLVNAKRVKVTA